MNPSIGSSLEPLLRRQSGKRAAPPQFTFPLTPSARKNPRLTSASCANFRIMSKAPYKPPKKRTLSTPQWAHGQCRCGAVRFEIMVPAIWAFHDHSEATRATTGAASMAWVGSWKKRFRLVEGEDEVTRYE